jgi:hypothetical protein
MIHGTYANADFKNLCSFLSQKHVAFSNQPEDIIILVNIWCHMYFVFCVYPSSSIQL